MRCEECKVLLDDYVDGESAAPMVHVISQHLDACEECSTTLEQIKQERDLYSWYEDEIWDAGDVEISPSFWTAVHQKIAAGKSSRRSWSFIPEWLPIPVYMKPTFAVALLIILTVLGWTLFGVTGVTHGPTPAAHISVSSGLTAETRDSPVGDASSERQPAPVSPTPRVRRRIVDAGQQARFVSRADTVRREAQPADFDELAVSEANDQHDSETASHFMQAQILLRSFRHANQLSSADLEHERELSRRLFQNNVLLRLGAASRGDLPVENALSRIEPVLLDISHLPTRPSRDELQPIRQRIERGELLAMLQLYQAQDLPK
jgi:putative zinc finger protein